MFASALTTTVLLLSTLAASSPLHLPRAGAPSITPVSPPCYIAYPMTSPNTTSNGTAYRPTVDSSTLTYSWDQPLADSAYTNQSTFWADCINQCNGLDGCKSAFLAYNVPSEPVYGTAGGEPSIMCTMYSVFLAKSDFVEMKNGSYVNAMAGNIEGCDK